MDSADTTTCPCSMRVGHRRGGPRLGSPSFTEIEPNLSRVSKGLLARPAPAKSERHDHSTKYGDKSHETRLNGPGFAFSDGYGLGTL